MATVTVAPAPSRSSTAICWLISLSSVRRIRAPRSRVACSPSAACARLLLAVGEDVHQRVDDHRLGDRLDEKAVELQPLGFLADFFASERRDEHDGGLMAQRLVALDVAAGLQAVHARHAPIHEDDVVGLGGIVLLNRGDGFLAGRDDVHAAGDGAQRFLQNLARGGVVIHDEHAELCELLGNNLPRALSRRRRRARR